MSSSVPLEENLSLESDSTAALASQMSNNSDSHTPDLSIAHLPDSVLPNSTSVCPNTPDRTLSTNDAPTSLEGTPPLVLEPTASIRALSPSIPLEPATLAPPQTTDSAPVPSMNPSSSFLNGIMTARPSSSSFAALPSTSNPSVSSAPPPPHQAGDSHSIPISRRAPPPPAVRPSNAEYASQDSTGSPLRTQRVRSAPLSSDFDETAGASVESLDIPKIVELVQQLNPESEMAGKTVVLLLGETGAGKTTALNFLAGRKFAEQKLEVELTVKGKVVKVRKTTIECVDPLAESKDTRLLQVYSTEKGLHVCDSPGLEENTPTMEVATAIGISNVLRKVDKVVILVVIKWNSLEERGQGLRKLVELVTKFLPYITEANMGCLRCVFTHVPNDKTYDDIAAKLAELLQGELPQTPVLLPKFLEWLLEAVMAQQECVVLRPLTQECDTLNTWVASSVGLPSLDAVTPLSQNATLLLAQFCSEVAVAAGSPGARTLEPENYKRMLLNLRILSQETRSPELKEHWRRYEMQLQRLSTEVIPQLQDSLEHRAFVEAECQLLLLERIQEVLGVNLLEPLIVKVGVICQEFLHAVAASTNLLNFASDLADTKTLQDRLGKILPTEYKEIHEQCITIMRETAEKYRERLEEIISNNDFEQVAVELDLLLRGVDSCKSFLNFTKLKDEIVKLVCQRIQVNARLVKDFLQDWDFDDEQAPDLSVEAEPHMGVFTTYTAPPPAEPIKKLPPPIAAPQAVPSTSRSGPKSPKAGAGEPESREDDKTGVIVLEGRKKFSVEVKVGGEFGRKVEWSFAIPDHNKVTFTVAFRDATTSNKPHVVSTVSCATHAGKYEAPIKVEGTAIFTWENKGGNILRSPKPIQFAFAVHVGATNASTLLPPPPPPPPQPQIEVEVAVEEVKVEDPKWLALVNSELVLEQKGARTVTVPNAVFSAFRALSAYKEQVLIVLVGDEIIEGILAIQAFVEDAKSRFARIRNYWTDQNFQALGCNVWRVCVLRRFSNPELKELVTECKNLYDNLLKSSVSAFQQLVSEAKKASVWQIRALEESTRVWILLKLQHQQDLLNLLRQARISVLERMSRFFHTLATLSMKALATQFVEQVAPFQLNYPIAVGTLTKSVVQRFISQMLVIEQHLSAESSFIATEDVFSGIVQLQGYERYADIKDEAEEIISCYKKLLQRFDTELVEMSEDPQRQKAFLDTLFLAFSCFSRLKTHSGLSPDYVYGASILEKLVSDPAQADHLRAFLQWAKVHRPEWFQCTVEIIDDAAPALPTILALFPNLYTQFRELNPLRDLFARMLQLDELCQGSSIKLRQTLGATRTALDKRLLELLVGLRKVRPPPTTLTVLIAGCASDDLIGSPSFNEEWDLALNKLQRDSALCQRGWKEFLDILQDCRRKADGRRLLVVLDKPLFDIFRIIWRANVPFSVFHALTALRDWWSQEVKADCVDPRVLLEEKGSNIRLQLPAEALMSVRSLWKSYFVLANTLTKLETANFISAKSITGFSAMELRKWLLDFLEKLVALGTTAINGLHLSVINHLLQLFGELESLLAMQSDQTSPPSSVEALISVCRSRINQIREKYQEDKTAPARVKVLLEIRRFSVAIDNLGLAKFVRSTITEMLDQIDPVNLLELGSLLDMDPLGLRLIHEYPHFHLERIRLHNRLTGGLPFGVALEELQRRTEPYYPLDAAKLSLAWKRYSDVSNPHMKKLLDQKLSLNELVTNARRLASGRDIPAILAHVCSAYSLLKSKGSAKALNDTPTPHPTQMLALFVMLLDALMVMLLDESKETHLVEMEAGKSLLVGLLATTLAVQGFEVHVACYNEVLASQARRNFADVFEAFGVEDQVKFETFGGLVNDAIGCVGDIRALTDSLVSAVAEDENSILEQEQADPLLPPPTHMHLEDIQPPPPPSTPPLPDDIHPPPPPLSPTHLAEVQSLHPLSPTHLEDPHVPPPPPPLDESPTSTQQLQLPRVEEVSEPRQPPPPPTTTAASSPQKEKSPPPPPPKSRTYLNLWEDDDEPRKAAPALSTQKSTTKVIKPFSLFGDEYDTKENSGRPRVLLMDDVVLTQREVRGSVERLDLIKKSPAITAMCNYIFENRSRALRLSMLKRLDIFGQLQKEFKQEAHPLLSSCLLRLIADVKKIDHPSFAYTIVERDGRNMLGYHTNKGFDTETSYQGVTMFQYMKEHAKGKIDAEMLTKKVGLYICCGAYAYVELLNNYQRVFGATGNYEDLEDMDKLLLRESFNVHQVTRVGSMYGDRRDRLEREPVRVLTSDDAQYHAIRETVDTIRRIAIEKKGKIPPILIMFENDLAIKKFASQILNAQWIADLNRDCFIVRLSCENIDYALTKSMLPGAVTIFPASLGSNLDFFCYEQGIDEQHGVHVIQTFLSMELREEIQIQNRTACKKHRGTFIRLFSLVQLKNLFGVVDTDVLRPHVDPEPILQRARHDFYSGQTGDRHQRMIEARRLHERTWQYLEALKQERASIQSLRTLNAPPTHVVKLLCLMEATVTMKPVWSHLKTIVDSLVMRLEEFLGIDNFKVKFVAFRDYDCDGHVTEPSPWLSEPATISTWLESIEFVAHDTVAMEAALHVANDKDDPPTRVLLFGSSPPRAIKAEENHPYVLECKELGNRGIPVFTYHLGGISPVSENIATLTHGRARVLSAEDLLDIISITALDDLSS